MVINPAYYTHPQHGSRQQSQRLQGASQHYLARVDHEITGAFLQAPLEPHTGSRDGNKIQLQIQKEKFVGFRYPLQNDIEWALEFSRIVEKGLGVNSQGFTMQVGRGDTFHVYGYDLEGGNNYSWNPTLNGLNQGLRKYYLHRKNNFMRNNSDTRKAVTMSLTL